MTLTELKYVIAVARERHFGRAAESCFVSQPSLSVAIKKLEEELGVSIFERRTPDISITPVGAAIIEQAQKVLEESRLISEIAKRGQDPLAGPIRLGMIYTVAPYLMPELIVKLSTLAPKMPVYLEETYTTELISQLRTGAIDVAIMADTISDTGFMTQALYQESFVVAVPSHHPWVNRNYIGPQELRDQTMLLLGAGHCFRDQIIGICPDLVRANIGIADVQRTVEGLAADDLPHGRPGARHYRAARLLRALSALERQQHQDDPVQEPVALAPRHHGLAQELHAHERDRDARPGGQEHHAQRLLLS